MDDRRAAMLNEMLAVTADAIARVVENLKAIEQALRLGRKKLSRSCETLRDRIGTTMLSLPGVKNPPDATIA